MEDKKKHSEADIARIFKANFDNARSYGLEMEFIMFFLRDLKVSHEQVLDAIGHANREWDL